MKILVIGSGGREHALAWKIAQSERVQHVFVAPGNAGTARDSRLINVDMTAIDDLINFVKTEQIAYTVVGPEAPLAAGIADRFNEAGLKIFGPTAKGAQLETSKDFAKSFMRNHNIPTADSETFIDNAAAHQYLDRKSAPIVIKADGLAAGKGVIVAMTMEEAHQAVDDILSGKSVGDAGHRILIEDFFEGEEASFIIAVNGTKMVTMATSQDHKRLLDGDLGANTGGMGAYSPAPIVTPDLHAKILREVVDPTLQGLQKEGIHYVGFLYAGLMITADQQIKVLEFNCRMGDPETQVIMPRLKTDAATLFEAAIDGSLDQIDVEWDRRCALGVVLAAYNYPSTPRLGDIITGLDHSIEDTVVFHAGTAIKDDKVVTNGGRVLCVVALGDSVKMAQKLAYERADLIQFSGKQLRRDIGYRAIRRAVLIP